MNWIPRSATETIRERIKHYPALTILGARQVGKSSLVRKFFEQEIERPTLFLDLEIAEDREKLQYPREFLLTNRDKVVAIDEIQLLPSLFSDLRPIIDEHGDQVKYLLLGSASPSIVHGASETLAGRNSWIDLHPLTLSEIREVTPLEDHWFYGGYPALQYYAPDRKRQWYEDYLRSLTLVDLPQLGLELDSRDTRRLLMMLAHQTGGLLNYAAISRSLGLDQRTVKKYVDYLEGSFIVFRLPAFSHNVRKRLVKSPKIYFRDTGILHHLLGVKDRNALLGSPILGNSWENYAVQQIVANLPVGHEASFYRTQNGAEIDLVISEGFDVKWLGEIKISARAKLTKGNFSAFDDFDAVPKFRIIKDSDRFRLSSDIESISLAGLIASF